MQRLHIRMIWFGIVFVILACGLTFGTIYFIAYAGH